MSDDETVISETGVDPLTGEVYYRPLAKPEDHSYQCLLRLRTTCATAECDCWCHRTPTYMWRADIADRAESA